ncbi:hypothetical protein ACP70R_044384 [Stipagrostis hirtigluma subsp. patula]
MEIAALAVGSLLPKLQAYLRKRSDEGDDSQPSHDRDVVQLLSHELTSVHAALREAARAPPGQPRDDEQGAARVWSREARELAYDVEDAIDALLVTPSATRPEEDGDRVHDPEARFDLRALLRRATELSGARPRTADGAPPARATVEHPRPQQHPPPDNEPVLVGVDDARDALIRRLRLRQEAGDGEVAAREGEVKMVPVVGSAGMGKTTLAGVAYDVLRPQFDCAAFVAVGPNPDIAEVLESMLRQLGCAGEAAADEPRDETQLMSQLRGLLRDKRYLIVLDDLWDKPSWEKIRCALVDNNDGSRIVATTQNFDVAEQVGIPYELKPLSVENSKILFFRTMFGHQENSGLDDEFAEVADKILKKCGGVPLAIVTLAKLLASKMGDRREWHKVYKSIGSGLENTPDVKMMRMVSSRGYYSLPPHLRACLLYMSIFPEDSEIRRDRLIWRWIAEGFVQSGGEQVESLFELGESYFDELVNRGMVQLLDIDYADDGGREEHACIVHFPLMDLISYLSSEESFVTVVDDEQRACPSDKPPVRTVTFRGGSRTEDSASLATLNMPQLRSISVFRPTITGSFDLNRSESLRVLDLEGCDLSESDHLQKHLGSLIHLRYLGLRDTRIASVPEEIGNLRALQTLDLAGTKVKALPATVVQLGELMCLRINDDTRLPSGIGNLKALEELSDVSTRESPDVVGELGSLTKLRLLRLTLWRPSPSLEAAMVESLRSLHSIQTLDVYVTGTGGDKSHRLDAVLAAWAPPAARLREFQARAISSYRSPLELLPAWVDAPAAPRLAVLVVQVMELRQRDVDALGRLPALRVLRLEPYASKEPLVVSGGAFPRLTECRFRDSDVAPVFRRGAAPRLRRLEFCFRVRDTIDLGNGGFEFGLENLGCLEEATVYVGCQESREPEAEAAEAALRRAADGHPNRAAFDVITFGEELMCFDDDDQ